MHLAHHGVVDVGGNPVAGRPVHVADLLGIGAWGEEFDPFLMETGADDEGQFLILICKLFNHYPNTSKLTVPLKQENQHYNKNKQGHGSFPLAFSLVPYRQGCVL